MLYLIFFLIASLAWFFGTIAAGGAALLFVSIGSFMLPINALTIIVGFSGTLTGGYRIFLYRGHVDWPIIKWLIPGTFCGAIVGASLFMTLVTQDTINILEIILGMILIISGALGLLKTTKQPSRLKKSYFMPFGFFTAVFSGLVGVSSPLLNVLFSRFSLAPNEIVATKAINIFTLQVCKSIIYVSFLIFSIKKMAFTTNFHLSYFALLSLVTTLGGAIGVFFGKRLLNKINIVVFTKLMNLMLIVFGIRILFLNG